MKKLLLTATIFLISMSGILAQVLDTTLVVKNHEIKITDNDEKVEVKVYELRDGVRVAKEPIYESRYNIESDENDRTLTIKMPFNAGKINGKSCENDSVVSKKKRRRKLEQQLPILYFNYINISNGNYAQASPYIKQRPASFEWGMYFPMTIFNVGHKTVFGMATGLGFSNSYDHFDTKYVMLKNDSGNMEMATLVKHTDGKFAESGKSYLRYWSLRLPLTLQLQWKVGKHPLSVSAGAELEWRFGMRSFAKYDGAKRTICDKVNYKPFGCNALVQVGYAGVILFTRMGLTDMFGSSELGSAYQFTAGIGFKF